MDTKASPSDLQRLRDLLVDPERKQIEQINERLESREKFSSQVSDVLPQAIVDSASRGKQLQEAMVPAVEDIVRISIERDTDKFANALFPVIGPSIRKAIGESIRQMLQSLNQMLESSLSVRGLIWRWQSIRTGVSFAQIVMLHSLVYRVEQVFLIHRDSGLLLNHLSHDNAVNHDADLVTSMLSAIADFVGDSFEVADGQALDTVQYGELSIWLAQSPRAALALAIRGDAPAQLRTVMQKTLEDIETHFADSLEKFDGTTDSLAATQPFLNGCLQAQYSPPSKKLSLKARLIWTVVFILACFALVNLWYENHLRQQYVGLVKNEPGYVITGSEVVDGQLVLRGLRDPLSRAPAELLALSQLAETDVRHVLAPYQSLDKQFAHRRMLRIIEPPENVTIAIQDDVLLVSGYAEAEWIERFRQSTPLIAGIDRIDSSQLRSEIDITSFELPDGATAEIDINSGTLIVSGSAAASWLTAARKRLEQIDGLRNLDDSQLRLLPDLTEFGAPASVAMEYLGSTLVVSGLADSSWINELQARIDADPAVTGLDTSGLGNNDLTGLQATTNRLREHSIFFAQAESFTFEEQAAIDTATELVNQALYFSRQAERPIKVIVQGYADSVGSFDDNQFLSQERAEYVAQALYLSGINPGFIEVRGMDQPMQRESSDEERQFNRRVGFDVIFLQQGNEP